MGVESRKIRCSARWAAVVFGTVLAVAQSSAAQQGVAIHSAIRGKVLDALHKPVADAVVRVEPQEQLDHAPALVAKTFADGTFMVAVPKAGSYRVTAEKAGLHGESLAVASMENSKLMEVVLRAPGKSAAVDSMGAMEFADKPNFTVAGVVDWTAVGGHGSDAQLRTTEALARETIALKPAEGGHASGASVEGGHALGASFDANAHRLAGEAAEKRGDPLAAVHEYEQAVKLDPSEENYFHWGSELLLHRAVWQAQEVFSKGAMAYPKSARIQTGLGTALFASAHYDEAAERFCAAADLKPSDAEPYLLMGKIALASPNPLACIEQKLAHFVELQPGNALGHYFYAMVILKRQQFASDPKAMQQVEALLNEAVRLDAKCADGYLQLGILNSSRRQVEQAIGYYRKAIEANPQLGDAHYRLGVAYDRTGEHDKAKSEFQLHDEIEKQQADSVEQQRREVKQFLVVLQGEKAATQSN